ncbi:MAG: hypothetical protein H7257_00995 [Taibaiella sp.]|nr:hypothetical protein [Taibaiella sp.]
MKTTLPNSSMAAILAQQTHRPTNSVRHTRRQLKHEMLLDFMAQSDKVTKPVRKPVSILKSLMSLFL